jgi:aminoglycoside phosphotransferase (APT) family kinase protein
MQQKVQPAAVFFARMAFKRLFLRNSRAPSIRLDPLSSFGIGTTVGRRTACPVSPNGLASPRADRDKNGVMLEIDENNAAEYLYERGWLERRAAARAQVLAWGVSNVVLRISPQIGEPFVLKQSRAQLRTKDPWFSRLDRIWREIDVMRLLQPLLPEGVIPRVLFEDRGNYVFGMEAAPAAHAVWKQLLLEGRADAAIARRLGTYLAAIHRQTAWQSALRLQFGDIEIFVQLRVDPFYRRLAAVAREAAEHIERLIAEMFSLPICLVHADFSPKNVLVAGERIVLVDFETGHYGDPAFDLGFFLSHLLLKSIRHAGRFAEYSALTNEFWQTYLAGLAELSSSREFAPVEITRRATAHLAACMWARIDGTSKIDYLDEAQQSAVRDFCLGLFSDPPRGWPGVLARLAAILETRRLARPAPASPA